MGDGPVRGWVGPWATSAPAPPTSFSLHRPLLSGEGSLATGSGTQGRWGSGSLL